MRCPERSKDVTHTPENRAPNAKTIVMVSRGLSTFRAYEAYCADIASLKARIAELEKRELCSCSIPVCDPAS